MKIHLYSEVEVNCIRLCYSAVWNKEEEEMWGEGVSLVRAVHKERRIDPGLRINVFLNEGNWIYLIVNHYEEQSVLKVSNVK